MLWTAVVMVAVGLAALWLGLRGRRIDEHPICRECGFDLIGSPTGGALADRCSECGAELQGARSIRVGTRRRRAGLIAFGCLLMAISLIVVGAAEWGRARAFDWNTIKPEWWLVLDARSGSMARSDAALNEILSRLSARKFSADRLQVLVAHGLIVQADPSALWTPRWAALVELAWDRGLLTPGQQSTYARAIPMTSVSGRDRVEASSRWDVWLHMGAGRVGVSNRFYLGARLVSVELDGQSQSGFNMGEGSVGLGSVGGGGLGLPGSLTGTPGKHTVRTRWHFAVREGYGPQSDAPILCQWEQGFDVPVEIVAPGTPVVALVRNESMRATIEGGIKALKNTVRRTDRPDGADVQGELRFDPAPIALAFKAYWRVADAATPEGYREFPFNTFAVPPGKGWIVAYGGVLPPGVTPATVDVILRPDARAAAITEDITTIWDGEIILPNQSVPWPEKVDAPPSGPSSPPRPPR